MSANRLKLVEDYVCDTLDKIFNDNIKVEKEYNADRETRAVFTNTIGRSPDDQHSMMKLTMSYVSCRKKRSDAVADIDKIYKNLPIYNKNVAQGLDISIVLMYITTPTRTVIDTSYGWSYTATFEITTT